MADHDYGDEGSFSKVVALKRTHLNTVIWTRLSVICTWWFQLKSWKSQSHHLILETFHQPHTLQQWFIIHWQMQKKLFKAFINKFLLYILNKILCFDVIWFGITTILTTLVTAFLFISLSFRWYMSHCSSNQKEFSLLELLSEKDLMVWEAPSAEMFTFPPQAVKKYTCEQTLHNLRHQQTFPLIMNYI